MSRTEMPVDLAIAQVIARKILENPSEYEMTWADLETIEIFVSERWRDPWSQTLYSEWESSFYWQPIKKRLPEILEKIGNTENGL